MKRGIMLCRRALLEEGPALTNIGLYVSCYLAGGGGVGEDAHNAYTIIALIYFDCCPIAIVTVLYNFFMAQN